MKKTEFIEKLNKRLNNIPSENKNNAVSFYEEMIEEKIADGIKEEDAISELGNIDDIVKNIVKTVPLKNIVKNKKGKRILSVGEKTALIIGSPVWVSVLLALIACVFAVYVSLWAVVVSLYATSFGLFAGIIISLYMSVIAFIKGNVAAGIAFIGVGAVCFGLGILFVFLSNLTAKSVFKLGKYIVLKIKLCFVKEDKE